MSDRMIERLFNRPESVERAVARAPLRVSGNQSPLLLLMLSLNLLLIVFFVVLNANSTIDVARAHVVLDNVQKYFGPDRGGQPVVKVTAASRIAARDALRSSVTAAFASVLEGREITVRDQADSLTVLAPAAALFESETGTLRITLPLLDRIARIMTIPMDDLRSGMTVTIEYSGEEAVNARMQAASLAQQLLRRDVPRASFAVGVLPAETSAVRFTFFAVPVDDARAGERP